MSTKKISSVQLCDWCATPARPTARPVRVRRCRTNELLTLTLCASCRTKPDSTVWLGHEAADEAPEGRARSSRSRRRRR